MNERMKGPIAQLYCMKVTFIERRGRPVGAGP